ncbi:MAG: type II secretion system F family protein [candidate division Zixibacteria bacterium]|nr:type II secretion system F family protein [candidate division Zixibacteria bacterium]
MPKYQYSGKSIDGVVVAGVTSASDPLDLEARLVEQGILVIECHPTLSKYSQHMVKWLKRAEITKATRQLSLLLKSEVTVLEALELVAEQLSDKTLSLIFTDIISRVEAGKAVADALSVYPLVFDELYVSMVHAGESSGRLADSVDQIASYREKKEATAGKLKSAMAYPVLVVLVAVLVVLALVVYIVPVFSSMYDNFGAQLPTLTQKIVTVSDFIRNSYVYWLLAAFLLIPLVIVLVSSDRLKQHWHRLLVHLPLVKKLVSKIVAARFCRTIGSLLTSGVDIIQALQIASRTTGNSYVHAQLMTSVTQLAEGKPFTQAIASAGVFPRAMLRLTVSGEKTGRLGEMLERTADYYEKETETQLTTLTSLIEPVIIVILGVVIAFILVAMYLPLFDLVGAL